MGAVTFGYGATGVSGAVSITNSLVGTTAGDFVGSGGITALANGSYVVVSPDWNSSSAKNVGGGHLSAGRRAGGCRVGREQPRRHGGGELRRVGRGGGVARLQRQFRGRQP